MAAWINHGYRDQSYLDEVGRLVAETVPPEMPVYGHFNTWFPLRERNFRWVGHLDAPFETREAAIICIAFRDGTVDLHDSCGVVLPRLGGHFMRLGTVHSGSASLHLYRRMPG